MNKKIVLLVDDEKELLRCMDVMLSDIADQRLLATDGLEALGLLKESRVDCIVCDIKMPRMDGLEFIKKVREFDEKVPFIFYTGHGTRDLMLEVIKYGVFDFLNKPNVDGLEDAVQRALNTNFTTNDNLNMKKLFSDE